MLKNRKEWVEQDLIWKERRTKKWLSFLKAMKRSGKTTGRGKENKDRVYKNVDKREKIDLE